MKEVGTTYWNSPNIDATNTSLFTGLPGGFRRPNENYNNIGGGGDWWSSTEKFTDSAWFRYLNSYDDDAGRYDYDKRDGLSVRCLRD
jgi:uncharacterized protein (TIGR02145 family)